MTKRQKAAVSRKRAILSSHAFGEWWQWRQHIHPHPSDPYRAYMIDIGLYARVHRKEVWQTRVNRMDYPPVDLPLHAPAYKRRLPARKTIRRFKPVPMAAQPYGGLPRADWMGIYEKEAERIAEHYHVPRVDVEFERRASGAFYSPSSYGTPRIVMPYEYAKQRALGEKHLKAQQPKSTFRHEFGHHIHSAFGGVEKAMGAGLGDVIGVPYLGYGTEHTLESEWTAHQIGKKFSVGVLKDPYTPQMKWRARWAFGTYLGASKGKAIAEHKRHRRR
jgi:hypothetical protein